MKTISTTASREHYQVLHIPRPCRPRCAVRVIMREGKPWFVANEVAAILGYTNQRDAVARTVSQ
jgi:hypothetical protein